MKQYTLTEQDIKVLIGVAGNAVCEDGVLPEQYDFLIMNISAEIAKKLLGHLSGENKFREEVIEFMEERFGIIKNQNQKTDFEKWYERIKSSVDEYRSVAERTALIVGYFSGMPEDTTFTADQISQIFELRYPKKE